MAAKPVVVGVDGSEESLRAVEWAALEARRQSAPLRIVSAPALVAPDARLQRLSGEIACALRGIAAQALDAAITRSEEVAAGLPSTTGLLSGPPPLAVAESGAEASMLVVGARGAGGFAAMVLGSVSRYAASRAPVPGGRGPGGEHGRAPRDRGGRPRSPGHRRGARVRVRGSGAARMRTWSPSTPGTGTRPRRIAPRRARCRPTWTGSRPRPPAGLAAALKGWSEKYPGVRVRQDVTHGHPARVLASYSARADLVVTWADTAIRTARAWASARSSTRSSDHVHGPVAIIPVG